MPPILQKIIRNVHQRLRALETREYSPTEGDADAIHDNIAGEIVLIAEKVAPVNADVLVIEDSAAANVKKRVQMVNLPGGVDPNAIHDNVAGEIAAIAAKAVPIAADLIVIEDSAAANAKKSVQVGNLPGGVDPNAIHDNVAGEIAAIAAKAVPINADLLVIEDSAAANAKKSIQIGNLPAAGGDSTFTATYATRPAASNDGDLFLPSDGFVIERDTGAAWVPWGPIFPFVTPVNGDYVWDNQGVASVDDTYGGICLIAPAVAGANLRVRYKNAPGTPYTITGAFLYTIPIVNSAHFGLCFRQAIDGKIVTYRVVADANVLKMQVVKWTNSTTWSAGYAGIFIMSYPQGVLWLRIADDGANRICSWSCDGQHWTQVHSVARADFLTADQVGFYADSAQVTEDVVLNLLHWKEA